MKKFLVSVLTAIIIFNLSWSPAAAQSRAAALEFQPKEITVKPGDIFKTQIIVDTAGQGASGVGAKIVYDKFVLEVIDITPTEIFADYPVAAFDNEKGLMQISGIVSGPGETFLGRSSFATVTWKLLKEESSAVFFEHKVGDTTDSNIAVTTGNGDILSVAGQLVVTPGDATVVPPSEGLDEEQIAEVTLAEVGGSQGFFSRIWVEIKSFTDSIFDRFRYKTSSIQGEVTVDPYAPIGSLQAKTSLETEQETGSDTKPNIIATQLNNRGQPNLLFVGGGILLAFIAFFVWRRRRHVEPSPYRPPEVPVTPPTPQEPAMPIFYQVPQAAPAAPATPAPQVAYQPPQQPVQPPQPVQPVQPITITPLPPAAPVPPAAPPAPVTPPAPVVPPTAPTPQMPQAPQQPLQ